jgi:myosin heavy subunit
MDSFTLIRLYDQTLRLYNDERPLEQHVDASVLLQSLSNIITETCKKIDSHKVLLIADKGCMEVVDSMESPVPPTLVNKRFMKTNTRSDIKSILKVLMILLGIQLKGETCTIKHYLVLLQFLTVFPFENEEYVSVSSCNELNKSIRKQLRNGPSFVPDVNNWKSKRDIIINQFYNPVIDKVKIDQMVHESVVSLDNQFKSLYKDNVDKSNELHAKLEEVEKNASNVQAKLEEADKNASNVQAKLEEAENNASNVQSKLDDVEKKVIEVQSKIDESNNEFQNGLNVMKKMVEDIQSSLSKLNELSLIVDDNVTDQEQAVNNIKEKINSLHDVANELQIKFDSLKDINVKNDYVVGEIKELHELINSNQRDLNNLSEQLRLACQEETVDEVKADEVKADEVKADEVEVDEVKVDEVKVDEVKVDEVKVDEIKADEVKVDEIKADEVKVDEVKVDEVKVDEIKADEIKADEVKVDEIKVDEVKVDEVKVDEVKADEVTVTEANECENEPTDEDEIEAPMIIDPPMDMSVEDHDHDGDIQIVKQGNYYMIRGTKVVIDIDTCNAIGFLDNRDAFHSECNEYVLSVCKQYDISFQ